MYLLNINHKVAPPFSVNMPRKLPERTVLRQGKFREIERMHSKSIFVQSIFIWCAQIVRFFQFSNSIQLPLAGQRTAAPGQKIDEINRCDLRLNCALVNHFLSLPYFLLNTHKASFCSARFPLWSFCPQSVQWLLDHAK